MDGPKVFIRKPTTIAAIQWTGDNLAALESFTSNRLVREPGVELQGDTLFLYVAANHSWLTMEVGEWIARDEYGFYPIKDGGGAPFNYDAL